jgi:hypothetical protein
MEENWRLRFHVSSSEATVAALKAENRFLEDSFQANNFYLVLIIVLSVDANTIIESFSSQCFFSMISLKKLCNN